MTCIILKQQTLTYIEELKTRIMKAMANLQDLKCDEDKKVILRNLSRIMDLRIIDIDIENNMLHFLYARPITFQKAKKELLRIGFPIQSCKLNKGRTKGRYEKDIIQSSGVQAGAPWW
ncbi:hypothetical protein [Ulvibacterium marinum]|uniref:hypothetical protein n=1 Tax=Ulvibacterium marinum TaxID=2419782 RepID=UPI0011C46564|nr:hypothetical protein [Ulvibacterium marinum]